MSRSPAKRVRVAGSWIQTCQPRLPRFPVLNKRLTEIEKASGKRPAAFTDFRKLLEDKSIDAVSIATPNHHHTLQTIWACQAGKDVYSEKPVCKTIQEGQAMLHAAAAPELPPIVARPPGSRRSRMR